MSGYKPVTVPDGWTEDSVLGAYIDAGLSFEDFQAWYRLKFHCRQHGYDECPACYPELDL